MNIALNWQLKLNSRMISGGSFVTVSDRHVVDGRLVIELNDESSNERASFVVHSNVSVGGKNYLLLQSIIDPDDPVTVVRLFERTRICAMDADRFSSLKNAFLMFLESGEWTLLQELEKVV